MKLFAMHLAMALFACVEGSELDMRSSMQTSVTLATRVVQREAPALIGDDLTGQFVNLLQAAHTQAPAQTTGNSGVVSSISNLLDSMELKLQEQHNASLAAIQHELDHINECSTNLSGFGSTDTRQTSQEYLDAYKSCKSVEEEYRKNMSSCDEYCLEEVTVKGMHCVAVDVECSALSCDPIDEPPEALKAYLKRMIAQLDQYELIVPSTSCNTHGSSNQTHCCEDVLEKSSKCFKRCNGIVHELVPDEPKIEMPGCCAPKQQGEQGLCKELAALREAHDNYGACYDPAVAHFNSVVAEHQAQVKSRKAQQRSILRIECLVDAFGPDMKAKFAACVDADYTNHATVLFFELTIPAVPAKPDKEALTCPADQIPGTPEFAAANYVDVPEGITPCSSVNCASVCDETVPLTWKPTALLNSTTTTTTESQVLSTCFKHATGKDTVVWYMGTAMPVHSVSVKRSADTKSVSVYLTDVIDGPIPEADLCGEIISPDPVHCTSQTAAHYVVLKGKLRGTVVSGNAAGVQPSWCDMKLDGASFKIAPDEGVQFSGYTYTSR